MSSVERKRALNFLAIVLGGLLVGLGVVGLVLLGFSRASSSPQTTVTGGLRVGSQAPDFELADLDGESVRLSTFMGRPVMINFWATWCGPCRSEMPLIQQRFEDYTPDLAVLAVNFLEDEEDVRPFVEELGLTFDVLLDSKGDVDHLYQVRSYPTTLFIDREGVVRAVHIGVLTEGQIDKYLNIIGLD